MREAESVFGIDLNHIFEHGYRAIFWRKENKPTYIITITHLDNTFLSIDTTCYLANGFGLPDHIKRFIDNMIAEGKTDKKVHFSFKTPGIIYRQSLYLHIQIEESI